MLAPLVLGVAQGMIPVAAAKRAAAELRQHEEAGGSIAGVREPWPIPRRRGEGDSRDRYFSRPGYSANAMKDRGKPTLCGFVA
jgi:hypothetical protein